MNEEDEQGDASQVRELLASGVKVGKLPDIDKLRESRKSMIALLRHLCSRISFCQLFCSSPNLYNLIHLSFAS